MTFCALAQRNKTGRIGLCVRLDYRDTTAHSDGQEKENESEND